MLTVIFLFTHLIKFLGLLPEHDPDEDEYVEGVVCKASEIAENEMKECQLSDAGKVLLIKQNGKLNAIGALCPHADAPFIEAALGNGRIRCQRHGACYNILNGDIEDYPSFDALPCFEVKIRNDEVVVRGKRREVETSRRTKAMTKRRSETAESVVIVGGGPSGAICAETLRQEGFVGKITLVCRENHFPYDRVKVNKQLDFKIRKTQFRSEAFYEENGIEVLRGVSATNVRTDSGSIDLSNGRRLRYDYLYVATGLDAVKAPVLGAELRNVCVLRECDHTMHFNSLLTSETKVVILGAGFIGFETAAALMRKKVGKVTIVSKEERPFAKLLGERVAEGILKLVREKGVEIYVSSGLRRVLDDGTGAVGGVELIDGTVLEADVCLMAVGSVCNTSFLRSSGIELLPDGAVEVDEYLRTNVPNVFAGGDIAHAPIWSHGDKKATVTHFGLAHYHGKIAAMNITGKRTPLRTVPFFWTKFFGYGVPYAGCADYDDVLYYGNPEEMNFVAFYLKGDEVVAVSSCKNHPYVASFAEVLADGRKLRREDLRGDMLAWAKVQKQSKS